MTYKSEKIPGVHIHKIHTIYHTHTHTQIYISEAVKINYLQSMSSYMQSWHEKREVVQDQNL